MPVYEEKDKSKWTKDGRKYYFRCYYTDIYGKRRQKESKMYKSRPMAKKAEDEFLLSVATTDENDLDVMFETVYKEWLIFKSRKVKKTTAYGIKCNLNNNILEFYKPFKLHTIKSNIIFEWYNWLESKNYTENFTNKIIGYFKELLEYAMINYDFDKKVIGKVEKKKNNSIRVVKVDLECNYWTNDEFNEFISKVDNELYYTIFTFLYYTGLRKGEMFALQWNDINFSTKTLSVNKQITNHLGIGTYEFTSTKTKNSDRILDLDDELIELLKRHYESECKLYGFNNSYFIFGGIKPISATTLAKELNKYIELSNVKKITPHGFRHSHASLLIHLGCDSRDVANRLGDTIEVVESTYYHMFPEKKTVTVNKLNEFKIRGK